MPKAPIPIKLCTNDDAVKKQAAAMMIEAGQACYQRLSPFDLDCITYFLVPVSAPQRRIEKAIRDVFTAWDICMGEITVTDLEQVPEAVNAPNVIAAKEECRRDGKGPVRLVGVTFHYWS